MSTNQFACRLTCLPEHDANKREPVFRRVARSIGKSALNAEPGYLHLALAASLALTVPAAAQQDASAGAGNAEIIDFGVSRAADTVFVFGMQDQSARTVGSSVTVISADDIELAQYSFAADALTLSPGVAVARNGGYGGFASARIRGGSSGQTLVVIDGVNVNDSSAPQGGYSFANLDVADIERIEVLRGPQSLVWGADAIGGVIYIETKQYGPKLSAYAEGGARATFRGGVSAFVSSGSSRLRGTVSGVRTDGISRASSGVENDGFRSLAASLSAGAELGDQADLLIAARVADSRVELDGFPPPMFSFADTAEKEETDEFALSGRLAHRAGTSYVGAITLSASGIDRADFDAGAPTFSAKGRRFGAHYRGSWAISDRIRLTGGGEFERSGAETSGVDESVYAGAAFAIVEAEPLSGLSVSAGLRRDEFSAFKGASTSRLAAVWRIYESAHSATRLRASWGQGFRAPSLFELHFDQFGIMPNPDLRPERANGFDIGVEFDRPLSGANLRATYFRQRVKDQIDFDFAGNGYFNLARVNSNGVEVETRLAVAPGFSAQLVYSFIKAKDALSGAAILRTPKHSGAVTLAAQVTEALTLSASATINGREEDFPAPNAAFVKIDVRAAYAVSHSLEFYGRIENLGDELYEDVSGFGEAGRSAFAGVRVKL